jgi:hypothetical protein
MGHEKLGNLVASQADGGHATRPCLLLCDSTAVVCRDDGLAGREGPSSVGAGNLSRRVPHDGAGSDAHRFQGVDKANLDSRAQGLRELPPERDAVGRRGQGRRRCRDYLGGPPDVLARLLKVDKAYHSYHMAEVGSIYFDLVGPNVGGKAPEKPFFSSVEGRLLNKNDKLDARYWQKNLESPVLFTDAVSAITHHPVGQNAVFLEVGPHSALAGPLRQILVAGENAKSSPYVASMLRGQDCTESFLTALGGLYSLHVPVDFNALYPNGAALPGLPSYAWNNSRVYVSHVNLEHSPNRANTHVLAVARDACYAGIQGPPVQAP